MRFQFVALVAASLGMEGCGCAGKDQNGASAAQTSAPGYDLQAYGAPHLVTADFTSADQMEAVTLYRSGHLRDASDGTESCRSMEHHLRPIATWRTNGLVPLYSPWQGTVGEVADAGHGVSTALTNKVVRLRCGAVPEFSVVLTPVDLLDPGLVPGQALEAGEFLGFARLLFEDLGETAETFTVSVWCDTPEGPRRLSIFQLMTPGALSTWQARGVGSAADLVISKAARDAAPLACTPDGRFLRPSTIPDWFSLR